jgi:hypothetical protein
VEILAAVQLLDGRSRRVRVQVLDDGRWRDPPVNPGYRGHALITMAADDRPDEHPERHPQGTIVILLSPPTPHPR